MVHISSHAYPPAAMQSRDRMIEEEGHGEDGPAACA